MHSADGRVYNSSTGSRPTTQFSQYAATDAGRWARLDTPSEKLITGVFPATPLSRAYRPSTSASSISSGELSDDSGYDTTSGYNSGNSGYSSAASGSDTGSQTRGRRHTPGTRKGGKRHGKKTGLDRLMYDASTALVGSFDPDEEYPQPPNYALIMLLKCLLSLTVLSGSSYQKSSTPGGSGGAPGSASSDQKRPNSIGNNNGGQLSASQQHERDREAKDRVWLEQVSQWMDKETTARLGKMVTRIQSLIRKVLAKVRVRVIKWEIANHLRFGRHHSIAAKKIQSIIRMFLGRMRCVRRAQTFIIKYDPYEGQHYWFHPSTNITSWERPKVLQARRQDTAGWPLHVYECRCIPLPPIGLEMVAKCSTCKQSHATLTCKQCDDSYCR